MAWISYLFKSQSTVNRSYHINNMFMIASLKMIKRRSLMWEDGAWNSIIFNLLSYIMGENRGYLQVCLLLAGS